MSPETWRKVDDLLAAVLWLPTTERTDYLELACAGDVALRQEVEALLAADRNNSRFLEGAPSLPRTTADAPERDLLGEKVGPFRLTSRLGAGGMGTVYLGEREGEPVQKVAVKVLRAGAASPPALARFRREHAALARVAHDRIARFLDAGRLEDGRPYLVLEYVEGLPIDRYCAGHGLAAEARLRLLLEVCAAVRVVHRNLLVHRDLKPDNILVTPEGTVKLLDFGIAKDLSEVGAQTEAVAMTPRYASPEQVKGEPVTVSTDVYALGVVLYELVCGESPYRVAGSSRFELERAIVEQEPSPPKRLARDLAAILRRALAKQPEERYDSVEELARDLRALLAGLPVAARRGGMAYRAGKWITRHRGLAALGGAALVLLAVAAWQTTQRVIEVREERDKARQALDLLVETFKSADPYSEGDASLTAKDLLGRAQALIRASPSAPSDFEAPLLRAIGSAYVGLGFFAEAEPLLRRALELAARTGGGVELAEAHLAMAAVCEARGQEAEGLAHARGALAALRAEGGADPRLLGAALRRVGKMTEEAREAEALHREALSIYGRAAGVAGPEMAETENSLARVLARQGRFDEAQALFDGAAARMEAAVGAQSPRLAGILTDSGLALLELNRAAAARARFERALAIDERALGADHPDTLADRVNIGLALQYQGDAAEAERTFREVLPQIEERRGKSSAAVAGVLHNLAWAVFVQERQAEAAELNQRALALFRATLGNDSERVALSLRQLAISEFGINRDLALATRRVDEARAILERLEGTSSPGAAKLRLDLGQLALEGGDAVAAEPLLRDAAAQCRRALGDDHPARLIAELEVGRALVRQGHFAEAEAQILAMFGLLEAQGVPGDDWRRALCRRRLRALYEAWGKPERARQFADPAGQAPP